MPGMSPSKTICYGPDFPSHPQGFENRGMVCVPCKYAHVFMSNQPTLTGAPRPLGHLHRHDLFGEMLGNFEISLELCFL